MADRIFLLDGTQLAYRSHFAFATSRSGGLNTTDGRPTGATYGYVTTLRLLLDREKPEFAAVAFDGPREALHRMSRYPAYKSTRSKMPDELHPQFDDIRTITAAHGLRLVELEGFEADDVIGTLAVQAAEAGMEVFIVTGDKDFAQLVNDRIRLYNIRLGANDPEIIDEARVVEKFGVPPEKITDMLALMGDSSDNVPGAAGVGDKTAAELIRQYGTLEEVMAHAEEVKKKNVREGLLAHRATASLSKELVTLERGLELPVTLADLKVSPPDLEKLKEAFARLEFRALLSKVTALAAADIPRRYEVVRTAEELETLLAAARGAEAFAVAVETTSPDPMNAALLGIAFSFEDGVASYVPLNQNPSPLPGGKAAVQAQLAALLEDSSLAKRVHDAKFQSSVLARAGIEARNFSFDTMIASYCVAPGLRPHDLASLALEYFGHRKAPVTELTGTGRVQTTLDMVAVDRVGNFACESADLTWRLGKRLEAELREREVERVFREIEMPLVPVLSRMERTGVAVDLAHLAGLGKKMDARIEELKNGICELAGEVFNINSTQQLGAILFDKLEIHKLCGIARPKKTRTGLYSTDAATLEAIVGHPIGKMLLEYRTLTKLKGTYVDALPALVNPATGRIHTTFNQAVAATGRLSSDNPNLQNIPIRTDEGKQVRKAFVPRNVGHRLVAADYSQIELRILAHLSGDLALIQSFMRGEDIHTRTAAIIHQIPLESVTREMRNQAKVINYGLAYGMGPQRLASETGLTVPEARGFIEAYFKALPGVKRYLDHSLEQARRMGYVTTLFGRRRPIPDIDADVARIRVNAENAAVNTPIQGTAADLIKLAMIRIDERLEREGFAARMVLQVHDELVFDCPAEEVEKLREMVVREMSGVAKLAAPLEVDVGVGTNWLEAH